MSSYREQQMLVGEVLPIVVNNNKIMVNEASCVVLTRSWQGQLDGVQRHANSLRSAVSRGRL
jgi:hypothetical protein